MSAQWARELTVDVERILTPREVLQAFRALAAAHPALEREVLAHDGNGEPIEAYRWGRGARHVLWYGFPDPGEAVGATGLVSLFSRLTAGDGRLSALDVTWHAIPVLNLADQPEGGTSLSRVMKTAAQEVDWCVHDPRPETTALLALAARFKPGVVFPLHDEYHCGEPLPVYSMVTAELASDLCDTLRRAIATFGYAIDTQTSDPVMGAGFAQMSIAPDYGNSTFSVMAKDGLVYVCEVSELPGLSARDMVAAQMAANLVVLEAWRRRD